jgi:hypothetical protein
VNSKRVKLVSAIAGGSAAITMGVLGVGLSTIGSAEPETVVPLSVDSPEATTGETITTTTPPSTPVTTQATPSVTGTAPLPPEEEGLPG